MLKAIVNGAEKDIVRIPMIGDDSTYKEGWEIRDQQDRLIWGKNNTLTGVSPISFRGYGVPLKSIKIVGNTQQNGTPTPDAPIMPEFVGERTGNLFDKSNADIYDNSTLATQNQWDYSPEYTGRVLRIPCNASTQYTISFNQELSDASLYRICTLDTDSVPTSGETGAIPCNTYYTSNVPKTRTITTGVSAKYILLQINASMMDSMCDALMINKGSTPLPYEPHGYKLPITNAGQTTPIYLGQTQTGRRNKKLVLTGQETNWIYEGEYERFGIPVYDMFVRGTRLVTLICSHYQCIDDGRVIGNVPNNSIYVVGGLTNMIFIKTNSYTTVDAFKNYLQEQYTNGTPVTIWYVLAMPETAIVNEPLCKIGTYADELHSEDAGVSIPTTEGSNTLSIDTTLHPSNIEITGHIKSHTVYVMTYIDYTDMTKSYTIGDVNKVNAFTQRRRCNMLDDGTITAFYGDPTFIEDGSNGQVMVYQPKFYYKVEPVLLDGIKIRKCKYYISDYQLPGYKLHPAFIDRTDPNNLKEFPFVCIGAYEGCLQNGDTYITDDSASSTSYKLSSIAFTDTATNGVKPSSGVIPPFGTIGNYETTASNRGTGWHIENIWIASMNQLMFVIEMCNPNSQTALGSGVTNIPDTPNTANNSSLVGSTSSLGNGSGRATTTYSNYNGTTTAQTAADKTSVSYRGMENPFGNIWKWVDGMTIKNTSAAEHTPYICKSFAYTRNSTLTNYDMVNVTIPGNGYVTAFGYDPNFDWLFISAETNSSNTGAIRDYMYTKNSDYTCARLGGTWNGGAYVGLFCWALANGSGYWSRNISARICYLPQ